MALGPRGFRIVHFVFCKFVNCSEPRVARVVLAPQVA
jgi:hypothetical protein